MKKLILFWYGFNSHELKNMARRFGFHFDQVLYIGSHWMTSPTELGCVEVQKFRPNSKNSYIVITNKAEDNQLVPVIARLESCGAEFVVYRFYYRLLQKLYPLP